jgi:hypothetical protein
MSKEKGQDHDISNREVVLGGGSTELERVFRDLALW